MQNLIGKVIDNKYEIKGKLGKGGMGSVYYVEDLKLATIRAMKVIEKSSKNSYVDPIVEVDIMKIIQHSYLPTVIDFSEDSKYVYIVMEVIQGSNLDKLLNDGDTRVEEFIVINWAKQICSVLEYLHNGCSKKIIYKDLKPSNIIVSQDKERITLIDFGISQIESDEIQPNIPVGTRGYAPPEQFKKDPIDERVDIYALGATIYQLLTGIKPRNLENGFIPLREIDSNLSEGIEYIVAKCVQEDKELRYSTIEEVIYDLENIQKIGQEYENKKKKKSRKVTYLVCASLISAMIGVLGWKNINDFIYEKYNTLIEEGKDQRDLSNTDGAIELFKKAQSYMSKDNQSYYEIAKTYMANDRIDESIMYLNKLIEKKSSSKNDDYFNYLLGKSYFMKGQGYYDKAIEYFEKVKKEEDVDEDFKYIYDISSLLSKYDFEDSSNVDEIRDGLKEALKGFEVYIGTNSSDKLLSINLYMTLGNIYQTMPNEIISNSVDEQVRVLEKAYSINNSNLPLLENLAVAYREKARDIRNTNVDKRDGYLNKAIDMYMRRLELTRGIKMVEMETYRNIGDLYFSISNYSQAESNYKKIIEINKGHYLGYIKMASLKNIQNKTQEAREYIKQAENCNKDYKNDLQYI
ncbi:MAG: protein kinase, partial [Romboutsia timonensis]|uniref:protein kinase domain-containing protein n=1 Tax=Romboutsia timonensis TaxID=1776391 RepID=UPI002A74C3A1